MKNLITIVLGIIALVAVVIWIRKTYPPRFKIVSIDYGSGVITYKFGFNTYVNNYAKNGIWLVQYTDQGGGLVELKLFKNSEYIKTLATIDLINNRYQ